MDSLLRQYLAESRECLEAGNSALLQLEADPHSTQSIDQLFRALHTLKGGAGLFSFAPIIRLTHAAEDILDAVREGHHALVPQAVDVFFAVLDQLAVWLDSIESDGRLDVDAATVSTALQQRLLPFSTATDSDSSAASAPADFNWIVQLPQSAWLDATAQSAADLVALVYTPDEGCFFSGDDPLQIMHKLPGLCALHVEPAAALPILSEFDVYNCQLRFFALSRAPQAEVATYCAWLGDQVSLAKNPQPEKVNVEQQAFEQIIKAQLQILNLPDLFGAHRTRLEACMAAINNILGYMKMSRAVNQLQTLFSEVQKTQDVAPLQLFLNGLIAVAPKPVPEPIAAEMPSGRANRFFKVDQEKIDQLLDLIGEMSVAKNGLRYLVQQNTESSREFSAQLKDRYTLIERITQDMQTIAMRIRMTPLSQVFQRLPRLVRDMAHQLDKKVRLVIEGDDTEADKNIIETLADPLLHILRNSLDHGIESGEARIAAGKNSVATIRITAFQRSDSVVIEIHDDGRGIDPAQIRAKVTASGMVDDETLQTLKDAEVLQLVFMPGFSTAEQLSDLSGRGVGMDVVKSSVEAVGGTVQISSELGLGTRVTIVMPIMMAVSQVMTVSVAGQLFGIPMSQVRQTLRLAASSVQKIKTGETFVLRDAVVPLLRLRALLELPAPDTSESLAILLVRSQHGTIGLEVDNFSEPADVVMKPMDGILRSLNNYAGNALLADGSVLLVLDLEEMINDH